VWAIHGSDSTHALARRLSQRLTIPWVADYKDNWDLGKTGMAQTVARVAHRRRISSAVALTAASRIGAQELEEVFGRPAMAIYTGVDVESWRQSPAADLGPRFNIVFTGHAHTLAMSTDVVAEGLVQALRALPPESVDVHYFGHAGAWLRTYLTDAGHGAVFVDHGFTDRPTVASAQKAADLLLHLPYKEAPAICVKFLEYVASGRPVLAVPEERDAWGSAEGIMSAHTPEEMASTITGLVERWRALGRQPSVDRDVSEYEWRPQAERLFGLLVGATRAGATRQRVPPS
jgi:glycosyltransferase involved in cell wall biosynthesis